MGLLHILKDHSKLAPFIKAECIENEALFLLVSAYIDHFYKAQIKCNGIYGKGDQALLLLQAQCANLMVQDHNHYYQAFVGLKIKSSESVTHFLHQFTLSRSQSEHVAMSMLMMLLFLLALTGIVSSGGLVQWSVFESQ